MFRAGLISLVVLMVAGCVAGGHSRELSRLCGGALNQDRTAWSPAEAFQNRVAEAKRRGLRVGDCQKVMADGRRRHLQQSAPLDRKEADRRWDRGVKAFQNLLDTIDKPRREQNEFNRNLPLPTMPSTNYSAPPIDGCLNGTQWMMDSAGRWECQ